MEDLISVIRIELQMNSESKLDQRLSNYEIAEIKRSLKKEFPFIWYNERENKFYSGLE